MSNTRALSYWQMILVLITMYIGAFWGAAWVTDQLILDCEEQIEAREVQ